MCVSKSLPLYSAEYSKTNTINKYRAARAGGHPELDAVDPRECRAGGISAKEPARLHEDIPDPADEEDLQRALPEPVIQGDGRFRRGDDVCTKAQRVEGGAEDDAEQRGHGGGDQVDALAHRTL